MALNSDPVPVAESVEALDDIILRAVLAREVAETRTPFTEAVAKTIQIEATAQRAAGRMADVAIRNVEFLSLLDEVIDLLQDRKALPAAQARP